MNVLFSVRTEPPPPPPLSPKDRQRLCDATGRLSISIENNKCVVVDAHTKLLDQTPHKSRLIMIYKLLVWLLCSLYHFHVYLKSPKRHRIYSKCGSYHDKKDTNFD